MPEVKNTLSQRLNIDLNTRLLTLQAGGTGTVSDQELTTPMLKQHIERGDVVLLGGRSSGSGRKRR